MMLTLFNNDVPGELFGGNCPGGMSRGCNNLLPISIYILPLSNASYVPTTPPPHTSFVEFGTPMVIYIHIVRGA